MQIESGPRVYRPKSEPRIVGGRAQVKKSLSVRQQVTSCLLQVRFGWPGARLRTAFSSVNALCAILA
jgi:hypothetical protein